MATNPNAAEATIPHRQSAAKSQRRCRISGVRARFMAPPAKKIMPNEHATTPPTAAM